MAQLIKREIMLNSLSIKQKLTWLIACAGLALLIVGAADATTRIVPLGDSLTKGMLDTDDGDMHPTHRYWRWE